MVFTAPSWVPAISSPPSNILAGDFVLNAHAALTKAKDPFVDALSGKAYDASAIRERVDRLARTLANELGWAPNEGSPWDKVVGIFSFNTIDFIILSWAVHRLNGICLLLHASSSASEIATHLDRVPCQALFTCAPLLATYSKSTKLQKSPPSRLFLLDVPKQLMPEGATSLGVITLEELLNSSATLAQLEPLSWESRQGEKQIAYLCPTSGTSGTQKLAKITHYSLIANIIQAVTFEIPTHEGQPQIGLNFLPFSHIYGMILSHMVVFRGDTMVIHPFFDLHAVLKSIPAYQVERLYLVPPVAGAFVQHPFLLEINDLSSVTSIVSGAAPFSASLAHALGALRPTWNIQPGWGLTEGGGVSSLTSSNDFMPGSSGSLLPATQVRLINAEGQDVEEYGGSGEILLRSPSLIQGYLHDDDSNTNLFTADGWLRTGDVGTFKLSPKGTEHLFVIDRIKDMIKVKGLQVAPAEIENHLFRHPVVADAAVIGVHDQSAGERPKAYIVRVKNATSEMSEEDVRASINEHVEAHLSQPHWLGKRIAFIDAIPKSASGKILKHLLRDGYQNGVH